MAKSSNTGEPKARRTPARRRTDKLASAVPAQAAEASTVASAAGAEPVAPMTEPARVAPRTVVGDAYAAARKRMPGARGNGPTPEDIRRRAYEIYLGRGGRDGHDVEDWLEAERQLRS